MIRTGIGYDVHRLTEGRAVPYIAVGRLSIALASTD